MSVSKTFQCIQNWDMIAAYALISQWTCKETMFPTPSAWSGNQHNDPQKLKNCFFNKTVT